jgi:ATP-binding cassette subfamily B protein
LRIDDYLWLRMNSPLKKYIGDLLMYKMMGQSQSLIQEHFSGTLANKIKDVMSGIPDLFKVFCSEIFTTCLSIVIAIFTVMTIDYKFSLLLMVWSAVFIAGTSLFLKRARVLSFRAAQVRSTVMGRMVDILSNSMSVHLFSSRDLESKQLRSHLDMYVQADQKRDWWFLYMFAFQGTSFVIYQLISFIFLMSGFRDGYVTPGDFALIATINSSLVRSLWSFAKDMLKLSNLVGDISQGLSVVLLPQEIKDAADAKPLYVTQGKIIFDHVQFHYKGAEALFQNKSVVIEPGQKVGLVGYSGSGKTTFINLILRLYDVTHGRILIDGQNIQEVTQDSLHAHIAVIPQDSILFHRSVRENIAYGRADATESEIIQAAKRAHAHEFIMSLEHGYNTMVGERGSRLSGGQRQRIAIARAILKNAPILILDEATSQLDAMTEEKIQQSLEQLMEERSVQSYDVSSPFGDDQYINRSKTVLVIAHRLSTLQRMDRILVFDRGNIVQDGTHDQLFIQEGLYKQLWKAQIGDFIIDQIGDDIAI